MHIQKSTHTINVGSVKFYKLNKPRSKPRRLPTPRHCLRPLWSRPLPRGSWHIVAQMSSASYRGVCLCPWLLLSIQVVWLDPAFSLCDVFFLLKRMFLLMADSFSGGYGFGNQPGYSSYSEPNQEQRVQVQQNNTAFTQNFSDTLWHGDGHNLFVWP